MFCTSRAETFHEHSDKVYMDLWGRACFELDDDKASIKLTDTQLKDPKRSLWLLGEVLDHPELYRAYPDLQNTPVFMYQRSEPGESGSIVTGMMHKGKWTPHDDGYMRIFDPTGKEPPELQAEILHEIQHLIDIRDYRRGLKGPYWDFVTNPDFSKDTSFGIKVAAENLGEEIRHLARDTQDTDVLRDRYIKRQDERSQIWNQDRDTFLAGQYHSEPINWTRPSGVDAMFDEMMRRQMLYQAAANSYEQLKDTVPDDALNKHAARIQYYLSPHEAVARDVGARRNLTAEERKVIRPYNAGTWPPGQFDIPEPTVTAAMAPLAAQPAPSAASSDFAVVAHKTESAPTLQKAKAVPCKPPTPP